MQVTTIGLDLAKQTIQIHGTGLDGKAVLRKRRGRGVRRRAVASAEVVEIPISIGV